MSNESEMVSGDLYEELLTLRRFASFAALQKPRRAKFCIGAAFALSEWLRIYCPKGADGKPDPEAVFKLIEASR